MVSRTKKPTLAQLAEALKHERADAENLRRRHEEEMAGLRNIIKANVMHQLLPVIDNFERALKHIPKDLTKNDYVKGVNAIVKQFEKTLEDMGVERIKTVGEVFDPHMHEAISIENKGGNGLPAGRQVEVVCEELQPGYKLGDQVIRHAMVKVKMQSSSKLASEGEEKK